MCERFCFLLKSNQHCLLRMEVNDYLQEDQSPSATNRNRPYGFPQRTLFSVVRICVASALSRARLKPRVRRCLLACGWLPISIIDSIAPYSSGNCDFEPQQMCNISSGTGLFSSVCGKFSCNFHQVHLLQFF